MPPTNYRETQRMRSTRMVPPGQAGFGLLEVLISLVVVAVGILSVTVLQAGLLRQSSDSTARAEAMAIAQARIEDLRNYTGTLASRADFDAAFAATGGFTNSLTIDGDNASFERSESVQVGGGTKTVDVQVAWIDRLGNTQTVVLSTDLSWESPRAAGDLAAPPLDPKIQSPKGRAELGEGLLPFGAPTTPNGDGTETYVDGPDRKLVVDGVIVLTLPDACDDNGNCKDFAKINGQVFIDTATQKQLKPGEVQIISSDAAYCQRYYTGNGGSAVPVGNSTTSVPITPNGDYSYFNYRCYVGGGWYGNIGVLLNGGLSQNDKVCQGDPTASDAWKQPAIAVRRGYRGMLYKPDAATTSGKQEDDNGNPVYYSIGIGDSMEIPDPSVAAWASGTAYSTGDRVVVDDYIYMARTNHVSGSDRPSADPSNWVALQSNGSHDFVVSQMPVDATEGSNCKSLGVMLRRDSNVGGTAGDLFAAVPSTFFCLNPNYIDNFGSPFAVEYGCAYDPTRGTATKHSITGSITVSVPDRMSETLLETAAEKIFIRTSDGLTNCTRSAFDGSGSSLDATYSCDVYHWGDGWEGYVEISSAEGNLLCVDGAYDGTEDQRANYSGVTGDLSSRDFSCTVGRVAYVEGTVVSLDKRAVLESVVIDTPRGKCQLSADGLSYKCTTGLFATETWSGTITFTSSGAVCGSGVDSASGVVSFPGLEPGTQILNLGIVKKAGDPCPQ